MDYDKDNDLLELSDGKLLTNDGCAFQIHKIILARNSEYFTAMFCRFNKDRAEFTIPGVSGECLRAILHYIYTGYTRVTENNVVDLFVAADYLLLQDLYLEVKERLAKNMTDGNCLKILKAVDKVIDKEIREDCFRFVEVRFEWIMRCHEDSVSDLPFEILERILCSRSLYVLSERTVWQAIVEWTQSDIPHRLSYVLPLLLSLAIAELDEELAEEILRHDIITQNDVLMKYFNGEKSAKYSTSNLQIFSNFLCNSSSHISKPSHFRIPTNIHIVCKGSSLHVSYDENIDLWNKIADIEFQPDFLRTIGHNIYAFKVNIREEDFNIRWDILCRNFDLSRMEWVSMEGYRHSNTIPFIMTIDQYIYVLGHTDDEENDSFDVVKYDTETDRWFYVSSLSEIDVLKAVSIGKNIYVVGNSQNFVIVMYVFDTVSKQWSLLLSPNINRSGAFGLVEYHRKLYLIGGTNEVGDIDKAEVYDPATNLWKELPDIPHSYGIIEAKVLNDHIYLYEKKKRKNYPLRVFRSDFENERWVRFAQRESIQLQDFLLRSKFCTIDNADTIKVITKRNRDQKIQFERSYLKLSNSYIYSDGILFPS